MANLIAAIIIYAGLSVMILVIYAVAHDFFIRQEEK